MQITSEPLCSDTCACSKHRNPCNPSAGGVPKYFANLIQIYCLLAHNYGIHLKPGCKSHGQIIHYRAAKNVPKQSIFCLYLDDILSIDPEGISCSLTSTTQPASSTLQKLLLYFCSIITWQPPQMPHFRGLVYTGVQSNPLLRYHLQ